MNDTSGFDPTQFLGATLTEANTRRPPIPGGLSFPGTFGTPEARNVQGKKDSSKSYTFVDIPVEVDLSSNPAVQQQVGVDKVNLRFSFSIDLNPSGGFDMSPGKNNGLRQLREALNMNAQGQPFNLLMVPGRQVLCKIGNRPYQNEVYDEIDSIARLG
jgi:hypothetical protein